jgi:hypothetical protein
MQREWVIELLEHCRRERVAFFFKQWGGINKAKAGRVLEGQTYDEFPASSRKPMPDAAARVTLKERLASLPTPWSSSLLHSR